MLAVLRYSKLAFRIATWIFTLQSTSTDHASEQLLRRVHCTPSCIHSKQTDTTMQLITHLLISETIFGVAVAYDNPGVKPLPCARVQCILSDEL